MSYIKKIWRHNEIITEDGLNHIEIGIEANDTAIKKALQRDIVEANIQKVGPTETSRAEIIQKENGSSLNLIISKDVDENIIQTEEGRVRAEEKRVEAEQSRVLAEAERKKAEAARVLSENKRQQDTSAAISNTIEATNAAVAKAQTATDNATTAANKAEAAVSKLPLPLGNTLKGEVEAILVNVDDAYPAPLVTTKVMGQSNQITTTGKNLVNHTAPLNPEGNGPFRGDKLGNGFIINSTTDSTERIATMNVLGGIKAGDTIIVSCNYKKLFGDIKSPSIYLSDEPQEYGIVINKPYIVKNNHSLVGIYLDKGTNSEMKITDVQLIKGSTPTAYEPYTGGKPSPSPEYPQEITNLNKAKLVITDKNLLDESLLQEDTGNINAPTFLAKGTYVLSVQNDTKWWETTVSKQVIFVHTFDTNELVAGVNFTNLIQGKRSYGRLTINKDCNIKIYSYGSWAHKAVSKIQLEAASTATTYEPHKSKNTVIDLKGNELCSLPNGVKDEVVIDSEGNVSLIKRVTKIQFDKLTELTGDRVYPADENGNLPYLIANFNDDNDFRTNKVRCNVRLTGNLKKDKSIYATRNALVVVDTRFTDIETAKQILKSENGICYYEATPQTIPLGKVELPALPESTSNIWNDGNIPANVYVNYLKDVNIAYSDLENQINQITMALSMMDTPTVIPEISEDEPTLIPELEESPIEESSI